VESLKESSQRLSILLPDGTMNGRASGLPLLQDDRLLEAYRLMLLARQADDWAVSP
jgi:hypothetical protein